jgi:hypothetical protein
MSNKWIKAPHPKKSGHPGDCNNCRARWTPWRCVFQHNPTQSIINLVWWTQGTIFPLPQSTIDFWLYITETYLHPIQSQLIAPSSSLLIMCCLERVSPKHIWPSLQSSSHNITFHVFRFFLAIFYTILSVSFEVITQSRKNNQRWA